MKGDIPAAAVRLAAALTVRTHSMSFRPYSERESANHVAACIVRGRRYASLSEAARKLHVCRDTVRRWIKAGEARYAK